MTAKTAPNTLRRALGNVCAGAGLLAVLLAVPAYADELADVTKLLRAGKAAEALSRTNAFLAKQPADPQMRFMKGVLLTEQNKPDEAIAIFTRLTEDYKDLPEPYNNLAVLYAASGQYDKARVALEKAIRTNPSYMTAYENLGDVYGKLASQAYDKALALGTTAPPAASKLTLLRTFSSSTGSKVSVNVPEGAAPAIAAAGTSVKLVSQIPEQPKNLPPQRIPSMAVTPQAPPVAPAPVMAKAAPASGPAPALAKTLPAAAAAPVPVPVVAKALPAPAPVAAKTLPAPAPAAVVAKVLPAPVPAPVVAKTLPVPAPAAVVAKVLPAPVPAPVVAKTLPVPAPASVAKMTPAPAAAAANPAAVPASPPAVVATAKPVPAPVVAAAAQPAKPALASALPAPAPAIKPAVPPVVAASAAPAKTQVPVAATAAAAAAAVAAAPAAKAEAPKVAAAAIVASAPATKPAVDNSDRDAVLNRVNGWAKAWSSQDVNAYLGYYSNEFAPPKGLSRQAWADERRARIAGKGHIRVEVNAPQVVVTGDTAKVVFRQVYESDRLTANSRKTLVMVKNGGKWQIKQESSGS